MNMKKKDFAIDRVITAITTDGEVEYFYPAGEDEFKESIEINVLQIWYGEYEKVIAEYNTLDNGVVIRHSMVYTEYGKEPEVSSKVIG